jgi:hypothetical protein
MIILLHRNLIAFLLQNRSLLHRSKSFYFIAAGLLLLHRNPNAKSFNLIAAGILLHQVLTCYPPYWSASILLWNIDFECSYVNSSFLSLVISLTDESWAASVNSHLSRLSHQIPITDPQIPIPFTESQITIPNCRIKVHWTLNLNLVKRKYGLLKLSRHESKLSLVYLPPTKNANRYWFYFSVLFLKLCS